MAGNNWQPGDPEVARLLDRVRVLEGQVATWQERQAASHLERRTRAWQIILATMTVVVLPLASIGILALIHLVGRAG